ncbi:MAG: aromatic ring-hydroxylating dioxygenase subunit alpha [Candidatus Sericytochromatia bacterium]|uniref:Aromatic ring-hydroxylating dioxygenase subunit alpha n=1 Tax=Candidatus Tanganyikabacteria bacterium TaxID=2961651 RepID=A0A937X3I4_9BACT|nr:aromatic ring-hydroxylating dioxygenase subunit alpha [Candidatus Tanganyikabacteria bacterium]
MKQAWYIAAEARSLRGKPLAVTVCGEHLVLFRGADGQVTALEDRCSHRAVALSRGKLASGCVVCPYHGWTFDAAGICVAIPAGRAEDPIPSGSVVRRFPAVEQDGYVWVWPADGEARGTPFAIPHMRERGWAWMRLECDIRNNFFNVVENFIDNPHTGYIHGGLFRSPASHLAHHTVRTAEDGVVIDIEEEAKADSLLGRLLLRKGERVTHQDRFIAPATVQVHYGFGKLGEAIGWQFCTPVTDGRTHVFVHVAWSAGWLTPLIRPFAPWVGRVILAQDQDVLDHQGEQIQRFPGRPFCSTGADTANLWIAGHLRRSEAGDPPQKAHEKRVTFRL